MSIVLEFLFFLPLASPLRGAILWKCTCGKKMIAFSDANPHQKRPHLDSPWNQFGIRHFLSWMTGIAIMSAIGRLLPAIQIAYDQTSSVDLGILRRILDAWVQSNQRQEAVAAGIVFGSIVGLGVPAVLTKPNNTDFWHHPGRVIYALACSFTFVAIGVQLLCTGLFGSAFRGQVEACTLGGLVTSFLWTFYTFIRCRLGAVWRVAILWIGLAIGAEFACTSMEAMELRRSQIVSSALLRVEQWHVITSLGSCLLVAVTLTAAGFIELTLRRFRDWRVWSMTFLLPIGYVIATWTMYSELWRAYRIGNWF